MGKLGVSQNGWPVYDEETWREHAVLDHVEGVGFWWANDDVATVMHDFVQKYNDRIESITLPVKEAPGYDDWSHALRPVRDQTTGYSNHASCTAGDLNSTRHPRGKHNTYSPEHRAALHDLVNDPLYQIHGRSVLRDGEFYGPASTIDGMHIEVNDTPAALKIVADRIRAQAREEDDMKPTDLIELSPRGKEILKDDKVPVGDLLQGWSPGLRAARNEVAAGFRAMTARIGALEAIMRELAKAITTGGSLTEAQAVAAGTAGARAALAELGHELIADEPPAGG